MAQKKLAEKKNVQDRKPVLFARASKDKKYLILRASMDMTLEKGATFLFGRADIVGLFKGEYEWRLAAPLPATENEQKITKEGIPEEEF